MKKIIASIYPSPFDNQLRHELNASFFKNGEIYSYEEGKLSSLKNDPVGLFPERSIFAGMKELKIEPERINLWVLAKPNLKPNYDSYFNFFSNVCKAYTGDKKKFQNWFKKKIIFLKHHDLHIYNALGSSTYKNCFYLSLDGGGDFGDRRNTSWGICKRNKIYEKGNLYGNNSLASFHAFVTEACGYRNENGKLSGISSYGEVNKELYLKFDNLLVLKKNGHIFKRKRYNNTKLQLSSLNLDSYDRYKIINNKISKTNILKVCKGYKIEDVAATAEKIISDKIIIFLKSIKDKIPKSIDHAIFSGGMFLNVKLNQDIENSKIFKKNFFTMSPSDAGLSLGGIFSQNIKLKKKYYSKNGISPYLGPSFNENELLEVTNKFNLKIQKLKNSFYKDVASEISRDKIVGLFNGRGEYGQRSLGNRSILADPRNKHIKQKINFFLKKRDWFMPFAPAVLDTFYKEYFEDTSPSLYMQKAVLIKDGYQKKIPAAIHVDGTCRVQYVQKKISTDFWKIIKEFYKKTKIPIVLNTSFNRHGISTISHPRQAIEHLMEGCLDVLYLNRLKIKLKFPNSKKIDKKFYKKEEYLLTNENLLWRKKLNK